jgi:peptidylprolyl isomerase
MKRIVHVLSMVVIAAAASAQTPSKPATPPATPTTPTITTTKSQAPRALGVKPTTATSKSSIAKAASKPAGAEPVATPAWIKLPPGVPKVVHGPVKAPISLRFEDVKVGVGALGESNKVWHVKYTGWRAADGVKFDSWDDHKQPVMGKDGKPELGADGKPKMGDPQPLQFPQGTGRLIPGFDDGVEGMRIGGKRRIFIPWQLAYGTRVIPERPDHVGIPAKSDLIFDVELVDVTEMPPPPVRPNMPGGPGAHPMPPGALPHPGMSIAPTHPSTGLTPVPTPNPAAPATTAPSASGTPAKPAMTPSSAPATTPPPATTTPASSTPPPSK